MTDEMSIEQANKQGIDVLSVQVEQVGSQWAVVSKKNGVFLHRNGPFNSVEAANDCCTKLLAAARRIAKKYQHS